MKKSVEVLETVKCLIDNKINVYLQKEQMTSLDKEGKPSIVSISTTQRIKKEFGLQD
jgi:hypothetical protein